MNSIKKSLLIIQLIVAGGVSAGDSLIDRNLSEPKKSWFRSSSQYLEKRSASEFIVARSDRFDQLEEFKYSLLEFKNDKSAAAAFSLYTKANPLEIWNNPRSRIHAIYVPSDRQTYTREQIEENWNGFEEGMKLFIDMSSLPIAVSNRPALMVALEIVEIDPVKRVVVFAYLEGTPSYGFQKLRFKESPATGGTVIIHETWFRSYKKPVEFVYPFYHRKMLKKMHRKFKRSSGQ